MEDNSGSRPEWYSIDPGPTLGWTLWRNSQESPISMGQLVGTTAIWEYFTFPGRLERIGIFVVEDYRIYPNELKIRNFAHRWDEGKTLRIIGFFEYLAWREQTKLVFYPSSNKPIAYALAGLPYDKNKRGTHILDSFVHGVYHKKRGANEVVQKKIKPKRS